MERTHGLPTKTRPHGRREILGEYNWLAARPVVSSNSISRGLEIANPPVSQFRVYTTAAVPCVQ